MGVEAWLVVGLLFIALLAALSHWAWTKWRTRHIGELRFVRKPFLTGNEIDFYRRLLRAVSQEYTVMAQVSMGALIDTALKPEHPLYWEVRQHFSGRICDFVLCDNKTLAPLLVVELDDCMHDFDRDEKRDAFLAQAGLRTIRFWSRKKPDSDELREKVLKCIGHC
jgi:very-short-patch-repair endonuclease